MAGSAASPAPVKNEPTTTRKPARTVTPPIRVLAVDPGTRYVGVAFLVGNELVRADVENLRGPGMSPKEISAKAQRMLRRWISRYQPEVLVLELPEFAQSKASRQLRRLVRMMAALAKEESMAVRSYLPTPVRRRICRSGRSTRLAVARVIAESFPWLASYYQTEAANSWWEKPYWLTMFDAVAVGLVCYEDHSVGDHEQRRPKDD